MYELLDPEEDIQGRLALLDPTDEVMIVGDSLTDLVAGVLSEPDYDDAEMATRYLARVNHLVQEANILVSFGNPEGQAYRVRVVTAVPEDGLTRWDRGEEVTLGSETRVVYDPATVVEEGAEPIGAELEVIEVSGDTEEQFIEAMVRLGIVERVR